MGAVKDAAAGAMDSARQAAETVAGQVRQETRSRADRQREVAASGLANVADAVRRMSEGLREQDQGTVVQYAAQYGDALAGRIERTSHYLRERNTGQILDEVENFARRRPEVFLGAAFLLGLAATRFLKSSRRPRQPDFERAPYGADYAAGRPDPSRALPAAGTPRMDVSGATTRDDDERWGEPPQSAPAA
jgi:hypothetical protein